MKRALIISGVNWNSTWQRHQETAKLLAESGYQVDFLQGLKTSRISVKKLLNIILKNKCVEQENPKAEHVHIETAIQIPPMRVSRIINYILYKLFHNRIDCKHYDIVLSYVPVDINFFINKSESTFVYDVIRAFKVWGGYTNSLYSNEDELLNVADKIICDSFYLKDKYLSSYNVQHLITPLDKPILKHEKIVNKIKSIAYFGTVSSHVDTELLNCLGEKYKVMVWGVLDSGLELENVEYMGYESDQTILMNDIVNNSDCIIIPYVGNMDGVFPAKLLMSLYSKLPIFSSSFYDTEKMNDMVYVYKNKEHLFQMIKDFEESQHNLKLIKINDFINGVSKKNYINGILND